MKFIRNFLIIFIYLITCLIVVNYLPKTFEIYKNIFFSKNTLPKINLITHENKKIKNIDLIKKPAIFFFGFTNCPDICPLTLYKISEAVKQLNVENKLKIFFITLDPDRDGVNELKKYLKYYDTNITGITGKIENIKIISNYMDIKFVKRGDKNDYTIDHTASALLYDKNLNLFDKIYYNEDIEDSKKKINKLINFSF